MSINSLKPKPSGLQQWYPYGGAGSGQQWQQQGRPFGVGVGGQQQPYPYGANGQYGIDQQGNQFFFGALRQQPQQDQGSRDYWGGRNAAVIRGEWDDWKKRYAPIEDHYAELFLDDEKRQGLRDTAMKYATSSIDNAYQRGLQGMVKRDNRYGVGLSALEQKHRNRTMQGNKQALLAKAKTDMTSYLDDRETQQLSGGISYGRTN